MSYVYGGVPAGQRLRFALGAALNGRRLASCGSSVRLDVGAQLIGVDRIRIGDEVEVLRGCTLDARSGESEPLSIGARSRLKENVWLACYGGRIRLGKDCLLGRNSVVQGHGGVEVGDRSGWGPGVVLLSFEPAHWAPGGYLAQGFVTQPIKLGADVHIGANVVVLGGCQIGDRVVVGAGSVVTSDLDSGWVYAGSPARRVSRIEEGDRTATIVHHAWRLGA